MTKQKSNVFAIGVMFLLFFMIAFVTNFAGSMGVIVKQQFGATNAMTQLGTLANFIAYACMGIPGGLILKRKSSLGGSAVAHCNVNIRPLKVGLDLYICHVSLGKALEPHRLPDSRHGGIPHSAPFAALLAVGQDLIVKLVGHVDLESVFLFKVLCQINGNFPVAAHVSADAFAAKNHLGYLICRPYMKNDPFIYKSLGNFKLSFVAESFPSRHFPADPRKHRFGHEGD